MKTLQEMRLETEVPVIMTDQEGFIIYVNDRFQTVFGWKSGEILGLTLESVIPSYFHDSHRLSFSRFVITETSTILNHPLVLKAVTKTGQEIVSEHLITAEKQGDRWVFGAILRPLEATL